MKHSFKTYTNKEKGTVKLSLEIVLSEKDMITIASNSDDRYCVYPGDLRKGYQKYGLNWLIHLLRLYMHFARLTDKQNRAKPKTKTKTCNVS